MDATSLQDATLRCLAAADDRYANGTVKTAAPIAGGYSRITTRYEIEASAGCKSVILQYVPAGATGLVRVDRTIENDLLGFLSGSTQIRAPKLICSDLEQRFFDNAAYIFVAEDGGSYVDVCREAGEAEYGHQCEIVARIAANLNAVAIDQLPGSMARPTSWHDYLDAQVEQFRAAEAESAHSRPFLRYLARWLDENRPPEVPLSLVHGDFQISNMLAAPDTGDQAVLVDWELAHIGDPREDLGWFTMVCGAIPPDILSPNQDRFYREYRDRTGLSEEQVNPATVAYFLIISSIRTHYGMMKSSDALAESAEQAQSALAAYYMNITTYQHMNWMNSVALVEEQKRRQA